MEVGDQRHRKYIATGLKTDYEKLLKEFTDMDSVRFEDFATLWQRKKMSLIFCGRRYENEMREFTEECLRIAVEFCLPPYNFQVQVGALYLLYAVFFKQPNNPRAKIRMTKEAWKQLGTFIQEVRSQHHFDVEFIFLKLLHTHAFHHVATEIPIYPSLLKFEQQIEAIRRTQQDQMLGEQPTILSEVMSPAITDQFEMINGKYCQMKVALAGEGATGPTRALDVIDSDIVKEIRGYVQEQEEYKKRLKEGKKTERKEAERKKTKGKEGSDPSDPDWTPVKGSYGARRAKLKEKAFQSVAKGSKSRRKRQMKESVTLTQGRSPSKRKHQQSAGSDRVKQSEVQPSSSGTGSSIFHMPVLVGQEEPTKEPQIGQVCSTRGRQGRGAGRGNKSGDGQRRKNFKT